MYNVKVAKELVRIAKFLFFEQSNSENNKILIASDPSDIVRNAILQYYGKIKSDAVEQNIVLSNWVFHHMKGTNYKKYVGYKAPRVKSISSARDIKYALMLNSTNEKDRKEVQKYLQENNKSIQKLETLKKKVQLEVDGCIILPKTFHDWLHKNTTNKDGIHTIKSTGDEVDLSERDACYRFFNRYRHDKKLLEQIIQSNFESGSVQDAMKSLEKLMSLSHGTENAEKAILYIRRAYKNIKNQLLSSNVAREESSQNIG